MSSSEARPDPVRAAILAKVERRQAMLEELADLGMQLARQVNAHVAASMAAINEDHGGDPTRAFATISRTIRLTLAMEARLDAQILALSNNRVPRGWGGAALAPPVAAAPRLTAPTRASAERLEVARERLVDIEDEEALLDLPFEQGVDALRRDLEEAELELGGPSLAAAASLVRRQALWSPEEAPLEDEAVEPEPAPASEPGTSTSANPAPASDLRADVAKRKLGAPVRGTPRSQDAKRVAPRAHYLRTPTLE